MEETCKKKKSRAGSLENKKNLMECMQQNMGDLLEYIQEHIFLFKNTIEKI